jgi:hypothetical protein
VACTYKSKLKDYLDEKLPKQEMKFMESHIESCNECQKALDELLDKQQEIKGDFPEIDDDILVSKIKGRITGIRRITVYGILGFMLGLFSRFYTLDKFLPTKAMMALPYKLAEFGLSIFFSKNKLLPWRSMEFYYGYGNMGFFPYNPLLDMLASLITPAIVACFIAVMLGYLLSDKRVFRRRKVINFIAVGLLTFIMWSAILYGSYSYTMAKIDSLQGIEEITVYSVAQGSSRWLVKIDKDALSQEKFKELFSKLTEAKKAGKNAYPVEKKGFELVLNFTGGGRMNAFIDPETDSMVLLNGNQYVVSQEAVDILISIAGGETRE